MEDNPDENIWRNVWKRWVIGHSEGFSASFYIRLRIKFLSFGAAIKSFQLLGKKTHEHLHTPGSPQATAINYNTPAPCKWFDPNELFFLIKWSNLLQRGGRGRLPPLKPDGNVHRRPAGAAEEDKCYFTGRHEMWMILLGFVSLTKNL